MRKYEGVAGGGGYLAAGLYAAKGGRPRVEKLATNPREERRKVRPREAASGWRLLADVDEEK